MAEQTVEVGGARSRSISYQEVLRRDANTVPVPDMFLVESAGEFGTDAVPIARYTSEQFAALELAELWPKTWQMACREEEIPAAGDYAVYELGPYSIVVVRDDAGGIRAFYNSCLHRGTQLCTDAGNAPHLQCRFHGWSWNLDGRLRRIPSKWDFAHVDPKEFSLPRCQVGTWGGFVFINMNDDAEPLETYLGVLPQHFSAAGWDVAGMTKVVHVEVEVACNWKVAQDAFMESYHATSTHPQLAYCVGDESHQYDTFGDNISRLLSPSGLTYSAVRSEVDEQTLAVSLASQLGVGDPSAIEVPEGGTARQTVAEMVRQMIRDATGADLATATVADLVDGILYSVFPNFTLYGGHAFSVVYRFRPNGSDPNSCIVEFMRLARMPTGMTFPPSPVHRLESTDLVEAPELGPLVIPFNQDLANLPFVQRGLRAAKQEGITLANYQESRIRHFHSTLTKYVGS